MNIKKRLTHESKEVLPDKQVKQNIKQELGYQQTEQEYALANGGTSSTRSNKKLLITVLAAALACILFLGILLPLLLNKTNTPGNGLSNNKFNQIQTTEDFYIYGAASVGALLASSNPTEKAPVTAKTMSFSPVLSNTSVNSGSTALTDTGLTDEEQAVAETVNNYMSLVENLLGEGNIAHSSIKTPQDDPYAQDYEFKSTITYHELRGEQVHYILYYNQTMIESENKDDEKEESFNIEGILIVGNESYVVRGEREEEQDFEPGENETESELTFTAYRQVNDRLVRYIRMEQEFETSTEQDTETEQKFTYTYYDENERVTQATTVEYEQENNRLELLLTVKDGEKTDKLYFRSTGKTGNELLVNAVINNTPYTFTIQILTNEAGDSYYSYNFSDHQGNFDRFDDDDDD